MDENIVDLLTAGSLDDISVGAGIDAMSLGSQTLKTAIVLPEKEEPPCTSG